MLKIVYEDELPKNITKEKYDDFYKHSIVDFVRIAVFNTKTNKYLTQIEYEQLGVWNND
jgi:hypothetical protein